MSIDNNMATQSLVLVSNKAVRNRAFASISHGDSATMSGQQTTKPWQEPKLDQKAK